MINIIVATSTNFVIGKNNELPWNLPKDMKYFKDITNGHSILMGRKCWESIPEKLRPLPNRKNYVLTRNSDYIANGATITNNLYDILEKYKSNDEKLFIIGGSELYKEAFKHSDKLYLTQIHANIDGDVYLDGLVFKDWKYVHGGDLLEENGLKFRFEIYDRKKI